jgi:hypothetical protein
MFLNLFSNSAYHSELSLPFGSKMPLHSFSKKERVSWGIITEPLFSVLFPKYILNYHTWERSKPFEAQFNPHQLGFIKSKSVSTNPIAYLDFITRLVHAIHFDISNAFDLVPHALLILKLDDSDCHLLTLPGSTVTWPTDYLTFAIVAHFLHRMKSYPVCHEDQFWGHFFSEFS